MPTKQATFDRVRAFLTRQAAPAMAKGTCVLRGPRDPRTHRPTKCAVGCLLPDKHYSPKLEGPNLRAQEGLQSIMRDLGYDVELLCGLQSAHDSASHTFNPNQKTFLERLEPRLQQVAAQHKLDYT